MLLTKQSKCSIIFACQMQRSLPQVAARALRGHESRRRRGVARGGRAAAELTPEGALPSPFVLCKLATVILITVIGTHCIPLPAGRDGGPAPGVSRLLREVIVRHWPVSVRSGRGGGRGLGRGRGCRRAGDEEHGREDCGGRLCAQTFAPCSQRLFISSMSGAFAPGIGFVPTLNPSCDESHL